MTDAQLDAIEADLGFRLPADYRRVSLAFPFRPIGRDWVYWFTDDPADVINNTRSPHSDGDYAGPELPPVTWRSARARPGTCTSSTRRTRRCRSPA